MSEIQPPTWNDGKLRCLWANPKNALYIHYHDYEWGVPVHDDRRLFEMLVLESFQAGLSWECVLNKRESFREAFDGFDLERVCAYGEEKLEELADNPAIIRNRRKIRAAVENARVFRDIQRERGTFSAYLWGVPVTDAELALTRRRWLRAMDALLPKDIAINEVYKARKGFSARFDARSRTYTYRIADRDARPVLSRGAVWWHRYPLDVEAMSAACPALLGEQDFKSFCKVASAVGKPTHRCVMRAEFGHEVAFGEDILTFTIEGNAFLHSMVRTIVGTLVEIGMHRREPEWMREVIDACDRTAAGPTAPACGLTFMGVDYDPAELVVLD